MDHRTNNKMSKFTKGLQPTTKHFQKIVNFGHLRRVTDYIIVGKDVQNRLEKLLKSQ